MSDSLQTTLVFQDPVDGSGDLIIDIHPDFLRAMNVGLGQFFEYLANR